MNNELTPASYSFPIDMTRNLQLSLIPLKGNLASKSVESITLHCNQASDSTGLNYYLKELVLRLHALAMPAIILIAGVQETGALVCNSALFLLGKDHESISDSLKNIIKLIGACAISIIADCVLMPLYRPVIYQREKQPSLEEDPQPNSLNPQKTESVADVTQKQENRISEEGTEIGNFSISPPAQAKIVCEDGTPAESYIWSPIPFEYDDKGLPYQREITYKLPLIGQNLDQFLYPEEMFCVTFSHVSCLTVIPLLKEKFSNLDALILNNCQGLEYLEKLNETEAEGFANIRVLAIKGIQSIKADAIEAIATKIPQLAAFDLRGVSIEGDFSLEFPNNYIIVSENTKKNPQSHLDSFNRKFAKAIEGYINDDCKDHSLIENLFPVEERLSPVVCLISHLSCLRGLPLPKDSLIKIIDGLNVHFKSLIHLDLSENPGMSIPVLNAIGEKLNLRNLEIRRCLSANKNEDKLDQDLFYKSLQKLYTKGLFYLDIRYIKLTKLGPKLLTFLEELYNNTQISRTIRYPLLRHQSSENAERANKAVFPLPEKKPKEVSA